MLIGYGSKRFHVIGSVELPMFLKSVMLVCFIVIRCDVTQQMGRAGQYERGKTKQQSLAQPAYNILVTWLVVVYV